VGHPAVIVVMNTQAGITGINAVMYYSTGILSGALPEAAAYVSLAVMAINVVMTFPPIFLMEVRVVFEPPVTWNSSITHVTSLAIRTKKNPALFDWRKHHITSGNSLVIEL
jgi:hypothetical protein